MKASMSFKHKNGDGVLQKFIFSNNNFDFLSGGVLVCQNYASSWWRFVEKLHKSFVFCEIFACKYLVF